MISNLELDRDTMRRLGAQVTDLVVDHIATLRDQPAQQSLNRADADHLIVRAAPAKARDFDELMTELRTHVIPNHAREPHPHFMGYIPSSPTFPAVLGDWIASGFNFFCGVWSVASGPNAVELLVLDWFRQWLGMPKGTSGLLTSGGSAATMTAVVAARHAVDGDGTLISKLTAYTSEQAHSSVQRAAWIAGVPRANVRAIATDEHFRMRPDALRDAIAADRAAGLIPFLVAGTAGTTNTGAIDPLEAIADICQHERVWMHVDAAYGGFTSLLSREMKQMRGIERADSVTLDPHKWLFVPFECGCLLAREPRRLEDAFSVHPEYLTDVRAREHEVNFADLGEQLTRGSHALKVWLSVNYYGVDAIREAIARGVRRAEYAENVVRTRTDFEILSPAQLGIVCFRACPTGYGHAELDALNERINTRVNGSGRFLMSSTKLRGRFSLRLCTQVHRMTERDIDEVMAAVFEAYDAERA